MFWLKLSVSGNIQGMVLIDNKTEATNNEIRFMLQMCNNWVLLEVNGTRDEIAQACTHTQRHMNDVWSQIISCSLCFPVYCSSFLLFIQTIWDNSRPSPY